MNKQALIISRLDEADTVLQERLQEWGYLYFKQVVPKARCQSLLEQFTHVLAPHISLSNKLPILTGEAFTETDPLWDEYYPKMHAIEDFHAFYHQTEIAQLMQRIAGKKPFVYPMKMARVSTPNKLGYETPAHQDAKSHVAGNTMCGMWTALMDITEPMGRLKILPKSHLDGIREIVPSQGVGNVQCEIFPHETTWHVSDVEQGDVIIFHSCTIHAAEPNITQNQVRMSVDSRFCDYGAPVFYSNKEPHHGWRIAALDWPMIYQNWQNKNLQYYWQDYPAFWGEQHG